MTISSLNPIEDERYSSFVSTHPNATIFHSPEWIRVLSETYGFTPDCVAVTENDRLIGVIPYCVTQSIIGNQRAVSLPFSDFCEPLVNSCVDMHTAINAFKNKAIEEKWKYFELRGGMLLMGDITPGCTILTHDINLTISDADLFKNLRPNVRRNIRKAENNHCLITFETDLASLRYFYDLNCQTRREHGLPPQPWKFIEKIWKYLINKKDGFVVLVNLDGKIIAAAIFLIDNNMAFYKFGASIKKYQHVRPNDFMIWKSLLYCKEKKCRNLNLGRTESHHEGLLQFKRGWNARESICNYYRFSVDKNSFETISNGIFRRIYPEIFSRLPIWLLKSIGTFIYRFAN